MTITRKDHLLNQLREMPGFLEHGFLGLSPELLARTPAKDTSPLHEHLWHMRDCESDLYVQRIARVLAEDRPYLEPVDVSSWPAERRYDLRDADLAIRQFSELRFGLIDRLGTLDDAAFERTGTRHDQSEVDVYFLIEQLLDHDRDHRWRMASILREVAEG